MKRVFILFTILIFSIAMLCAANPEYLYGHSADEFTIFGYMDGFTYLTVDGLSSESNQYSGMPFDLLGSDVANVGDNSPLGRIIAYWSFIVNVSNRNWILSITANPMSKDGSGNSPYVNYHLSFYTDDVGEQLIVHSGVATEFSGSVIPNEVTTVIGENNMIAVDHRQVRFMLDSTTDVDSLPSGDYSATVSFILTGL